MEAYYFVWMETSGKAVTTPKPGFQDLDRCKYSIIIKSSELS